MRSRKKSIHRSSANSKLLSFLQGYKQQQVELKKEQETVSVCMVSKDRSYEVFPEKMPQSLRLPLTLKFKRLKASELALENLQLWSGRYQSNSQIAAILVMLHSNDYYVEQACIAEINLFDPQQIMQDINSLLAERLLDTAEQPSSAHKEPTNYDSIPYAAILKDELLFTTALSFQEVEGKIGFNVIPVSLLDLTPYLLSKEVVLNEIFNFTITKVLKEDNGWIIVLKLSSILVTSAT